MIRLIIFLFAFFIILGLAQSFNDLAFITKYGAEIKETTLIIWILPLSFILTILILLVRKLYLHYKFLKNETPQEKEERLKTEKLLNEWKKRF